MTPSQGTMVLPRFSAVLEQVKDRAKIGVSKRAVSIFRPTGLENFCIMPYADQKGVALGLDTPSLPFFNGSIC